MLRGVSEARALRLALFVWVVYGVIIAGIVAVAASEFGVSDRFIAVRMDRYGLLDGARS